MQKHTKNYFKAKGIAFDPVSGWHDHIYCEVCSKRADDIHHIDGRESRIGKRADEIENLVALCRTCHDKAHAGQITKEELKALKGVHILIYGLGIFFQGMLPAPLQLIETL